MCFLVRPLAGYVTFPKFHSLTITRRLPVTVIVQSSSFCRKKDVFLFWLSSLYVCINEIFSHARFQSILSTTFQPSIWYLDNKVVRLVCAVAVSAVIGFVFAFVYPTLGHECVGTSVLNLLYNCFRSRCCLKINYPVWTRCFIVLLLFFCALVNKRSKMFYQWFISYPHTILYVSLAAFLVHISTVFLLSLRVWCWSTHCSLKAKLLFWLSCKLS